MPAPKVTQASAKNAIAAAIDLGLTPSAMVIQPDGSMRFELISKEFEDAANSEPQVKAPKKWGDKR